MRIHFIGSEGASMNVLYKLLESRNHELSGSDIKTGGHNSKNVEGAELVVYTNAVGESNCELIRAKELNIKTIERAELLGQIANTYQKVIAVSGTHGKSTTTSMLKASFAHLAPTVHVGANGSVIGSDKIFITEACEYNRSFLHLKPTLAVVLNIELDHPDCFKDENDIFNAFNEFCSAAQIVVVNGDDPLCNKLSGKKIIKVGLKPHNDYHAGCVESQGGRRSFCVWHNKKRLGRIQLLIEGGHNVYNALACIAVSDIMGVDFKHIQDGLNGFAGADRRFQHIGMFGKSCIISDYAHHPSEIAVGIKTANELYNKVTVVFQPHTFTRTKALMDDFVQSLSYANRVILAPVYSAREQPIEGVTSQEIANRLIKKGINALSLNTFCEIINFCKNIDDDAIIFMGAGDIDSAIDLIFKS